MAVDGRLLQGNRISLFSTGSSRELVTVQPCREKKSKNGVLRGSGLRPDPRSTPFFCPISCWLGSYANELSDCYIRVIRAIRGQISPDWHLHAPALGGLAYANAGGVSQVPTDGLGPG